MIFLLVDISIPKVDDELKEQSSEESEFKIYVYNPLAHKKKIQFTRPSRRTCDVFCD